LTHPDAVAAVVDAVPYGTFVVVGYCGQFACGNECTLMNTFTGVRSRLCSSGRRG
jgi:hypothetical protein